MGSKFANAVTDTPYSGLQILSYVLPPAHPPLAVLPALILINLEDSWSCLALQISCLCAQSESQFVLASREESVDFTNPFTCRSSFMNIIPL
jgi:hypothetical protein